jgi:hypothetical protein
MDRAMGLRGTSQKTTFEPPEGQVALLAEMGFTTAQARKALGETVRPIYVSFFAES